VHLRCSFHDRTGYGDQLRTHLHRSAKVNLSHVFAGQKVGIMELSEKIWLVTLMQYDQGFFDEECGRVACAENPFGAKVPPGSMDHRNTRPEDIRWGLPAQSLSRSGGQLPGHSIQLGLSDLR
jgi:hypothetical protein